MEYLSNSVSFKNLNLKIIPIEINLHWITSVLDVLYMYK